MIQDTNSQIIKDFKWYYDNGYITSRDGNACVREKTHFQVTASGTIKNDLQWNDFSFVDLNGNWVMDEKYSKRPSIETGAHVAALSASGKKASVHVHSPNTVALAALFDDSSKILFNPRSRHLIEVLNTKWPELFRYTKVGHMVSFLEPGSKKLHDSIQSSLGYWTDEITGTEEEDNIELIEVKKYNDIVILQRHGVLAIGDSLQECMEHIVRLEHISNILLKIITASDSLESIL